MAVLNKSGFFQTERETVTCPSYLDLSFPAREVLRLFLSQYNGFNNAFIDMAHREGAEFVGMSRGTFDRSVKELEEHGFLVRTFKGRRITETKTVASQWEITCQPTKDAAGVVTPATKEYLSWDGKPIEYEAVDISEAGFVPIRNRKRVRKKSTDISYLTKDERPPIVSDPEREAFYKKHLGIEDYEMDDQPYRNPILEPIDEEEDVPF